MAKDSDRSGIPDASYKEKYHEAQAEIHRLRAQLAKHQAEDSLVLQEMDRALVTQVGYWRHGRTLAGMHWARFKWTQGPWGGYYVPGGDNNLSDSILCCVGEFQRVLDGKRSPILDTPPKRK